ncbi:Dolichyl-diphosphooligosaccharide--protein glycosyltransferase 48 kDa subunit, partial [Glycine soja]
DPAAVVVDHSGYAVSATEGDHTLIASDDFININLLFSRYMQQAPVLKVLSASPTTFSANPKSKVTTPPSLTGTSIIQA